MPEMGDQLIEMAKNEALQRQFQLFEDNTFLTDLNEKRERTSWVFNTSDGTLILNYAATEDGNETYVLSSFNGSDKMIWKHEIEDMGTEILELERRD